MMLDSANQETLQAYAVLGFQLLRAIREENTNIQARHILEKHQDRASRALPDWIDFLTTEHRSNVYALLDCDLDKFLYNPTVASTTPADHSTTNINAQATMASSTPGDSTTSKGNGSGKNPFNISWKSSTEDQTMG